MAKIKGARKWMLPLCCVAIWGRKNKPRKARETILGAATVCQTQLNYSWPTSQRIEKYDRSNRTCFCGSYMDVEDLAKRIREVCLDAVLQAYEDAGMQGLCAEGRWDAAVDALRTVDLAPLLREFQQLPAD